MTCEFCGFGVEPLEDKSYKCYACGQLGVNMTVGVNPQRVRVEKRGQAPFEGMVDHNVYRDIPDPKDPAVPIKGEYLGTAVILDSGHTIYAQKEQMEVLNV